MNVATKIEFLHSAIASQRTTLRIQTALAVVLFLVGLTVVVLGFFPGLVLPESLKGGLTLGGVGISASGFVPIFTGRRDKIAALQFLLAQYQALAGSTDTDAEQLKKLDAYFDDYLGKALGT